MISAKIGIQICLLFGLFISTNSSPTKTKRSIDLSSPCFNIPQLPNEPQDISSNLADMRTRTDALLSKSKYILSVIVDQHGVPPATANYLKTINFLDLNAMTTTTVNLEIRDALRKYLVLLFQSSAYIQYVVTNGRISQLSGNPSLKTNLHDFLTEVDAFVCATNIALIKQQVSAPSLTQPEFPSEFISLNTNFTQELYRAYIVMNDGNTLMKKIQTEMSNP